MKRYDKKDGYITKVKDESGQWVTIHNSLDEFPDEVSSFKGNRVGIVETDNKYKDDYKVEDLDMVLVGDDDMDTFESEVVKVNPASGLVGDGFLDVAGNPWYTSSERDFSNDSLFESLNPCDDIFKDISDEL